MEDKVINIGLKWYRHILRIYEEIITNNTLNSRTGGKFP
jgi:hypothetical protein